MMKTVFLSTTIFGLVCFFVLNCNDTSSGDETDGGECAEAEESCTNVSCCDSLTCCAGVPVPPGDEYCAENGMCPHSDRNLKENFGYIDVDEILERASRLPLSEWNYIADDDSTRHMGPMAQDFRAAFGLGADDRHIHTLDSSGVSLAAIQALYDRLQGLEGENAELRSENRSAHMKLEHIEQRMQAMERALADHR